MFKKIDFFDPFWPIFSKKEKKCCFGVLRALNFKKIQNFFWWREVGEFNSSVIFALSYYIMRLGGENFKIFRKNRFFWPVLVHFFENRKKCSSGFLRALNFKKIQIFFWWREFGEFNSSVIFALSYYIMR